MAPIRDLCSVSSAACIASERCRFSSSEQGHVAMRGAIPSTHGV
ncbi:hypothetical protein XOCgx_3499 [Xanthomonas oryzae pv. oryzicola]|nr:hypothetical protein XOCgx_3499 [Xanthomonas oryzae pv. oryzicola]